MTSEEATLAVIGALEALHIHGTRALLDEIYRSIPPL